MEIEPEGREEEELGLFLDKDLTKEQQQQQASPYRHVIMTTVLMSCVVFVFCSLVSSKANIGVNDNGIEVSVITEEEEERHLLPYSEIATIPPDPDALPVGPDVKEGLAEKYGRWHFWDGEEELRPDNSNLCDEYTNCDVPGDEFPEDSWQSDAVFVNHILNDADELVTRAMEAIFEE